MHKEKIELIKESFDGLGPKLGVAYSNKEMVDKCMELQGILARDFASRKVDSQAIVDDYAKLIVMLEKEPEEMTESEIDKTVEKFNSSMIAEEECLVKKKELQNRKAPQQVNLWNIGVLKGRFERWRVSSAVSFIIATGIGTLVARKVRKM